MVPRDFFQISGVPISQGSLSGLSRWVFLGPQYPLKGVMCSITPGIVKTIELFCTNVWLQLIIIILDFLTFCWNQSKMIKWIPSYPLILKLKWYMLVLVIHKHNFYSVGGGTVPLRVFWGGQLFQISMIWRGSTC